MRNNELTAKIERLIWEGNIDFKIHFPKIKSKGFESLNRFIKRTVDEKTEWVEWKKNHQKGEEKEVLHIEGVQYYKSLGLIHFDSFQRVTQP